MSGTSTRLLGPVAPACIPAELITRVQELEDMMTADPAARLDDLSFNLALEEYDRLTERIIAITENGGPK